MPSWERYNHFNNLHQTLLVVANATLSTTA